jgi:serine/threonine protein kinase/Tfp pilus assembly protein PilF
MNSTPSSRLQSVAWPSLATASILQVRLLADELRELRRKGERAPVRVVLERHPELTSDKSVVIELANEDLCQRSEDGEKIDLDEYCKLLPVFQEEVRKMAEAHGFLDEKEPLLDDYREQTFPEAGKEFMGFSLLRELGRGTFACVYLAAEPALGNRLVAVKVSQQGTAEAEILGRLTHRNIVPIHSVKKDPLTGFTVVCMPYLGSATLCDLLSRIRSSAQLPLSAATILEASQDRVASEYVQLNGQAPEPLLRRGTYVDGILNLGVQLAEALAFIHSLGICHCDLKPSNVLMSPDGRPMLLDFNLSFREQPVDRRLGGTFPYMSPELLRALDPKRKGFPVQVDARADVFSLGVMLRELLTGDHPFGPIDKQETYEDLRKWLLEQQSNGVRSPWSKNPKVDSRIRRVLDQCLAFRPEDRPQTSLEFAKNLRSCLSPGRRLRRWAALNVRLLVEIAALAVAVISLGTLLAIPKEPYAVRQFNKGVDLYGLGRYEESSEAFSRAIQADPKNADAHFARGRAFQKMNQFAPAAEAYLSADKLKSDPRVEACLGYCSAQLGYHLEAIAQENAAIECDFRTAEVLNNRGYSWLKLKKLEKAENDFAEAIRLNPNLQAPYYNLALLELARAYQAPERKQVCLQGIKHIQQALKVGREAQDLYYTGAKLYALAAEEDASFITQALDYLEKAVRLGLAPGQLANDAVGLKAVAGQPRFRRLICMSPQQSSGESTDRLLNPLSD